MKVRIIISNDNGEVLEMQDINVTKQYLKVFEMGVDKTFKNIDEVAELNIGAVKV